MMSRKNKSKEKGRQKDRSCVIRCGQANTGPRKIGALVSQALARRLIRIAKKLFFWSDPYVSEKDISEALMNWKNKSNQILYKLTTQRCRHMLAQTLCEEIALENDEPVMRPVLPTASEISDMVDVLVIRHESRIRECMTRLELDSLVRSLDQDRGKCQMEIIDRVDRFQSFMTKRDKCLIFLSEMRGFHAAVSEIRSFTQMDHDTDRENRLTRLLEDIFAAWDHFEKGSDVKHVRDLCSFHAGMDVWHSAVHDLCDMICCVKDAHPESFIAGYRARKFPESRGSDEGGSM